MNWKSVLSIVLLTVILLVLANRPAFAQPLPRQPELADELDTLFDRASTPANQQKFLSVLIFLLFGGGSTYCIMRGIKKVVRLY